MNYLKQIFTAFVIVVSVTIVPAGVQAEDLIDQSSSVFKFQKKLAMSGNVLAQYKLAAMYETGNGVSVDEAQAAHWYTKAASAGSSSAAHRLTYLEVKQSGYDAAKHKPWLDAVVQDANADNAEAVYLLAQLYSEGVGVEQDLSKSLDLFNQVRVQGNANVQNDIRRLRQEIAQAKQAEAIKQKQKEIALAEQQKQDQLQQAKREQKQNEQQQKDEVLTAEAKQKAEEEKRRRYEEVMKEIRMQQKLIDEQQAKITGNDVATIDDEI